MKKLIALLLTFSLASHSFGQLTPGSPISTGTAQSLTPATQAVAINFLSGAGNLRAPDWTNTNVVSGGTAPAAIEAGTLPQILRANNANSEIIQATPTTAWSTTSNPAVNDAISTASVYMTVMNGGAQIANASRRVTFGVRFTGGNSKTFSVTVNPANGQILNSAGPGVSVSVQPIPVFDAAVAGTINVWYRVGLGVKNSAPYSTTVTFFFDPADSSLALGTDVIAYGAQLETTQGSYTTTLKTNPTPTALIVSPSCATGTCTATTLPGANARYAGSLPRQSTTDTKLMTPIGTTNYTSALNGTTILMSGGTLTLPGASVFSNRGGVANGEYFTVSTFPGGGASTLTATNLTCITSPATWSTVTAGNSVTVPANSIMELRYSTTYANPPNCIDGEWIITSTYAGGTTPTPSFPAAGGAGTILRSDGTNWAVSQDTWPDLIASGNVVFATAANTVGSNAAFTWASNVLTTPIVNAGNGATATPSVNIGDVSGVGFYHKTGTTYLLFASGGSDRLAFGQTQLEMPAANALTWSATSAPDGTTDTSLSRISAGVVGVGTGAAGSVAGTLQATQIITGLGSSASAGLSITVPSGTVGDYWFNTGTKVFAGGGVNNIAYNSGAQAMRAAYNLQWSSNDPTANAADTNLSRVSAGVVGVGTGAQGSVAGTVSAKTYLSTLPAATTTQWLTVGGSTTGATFGDVTNTGGMARWGIESSAGGVIGTGTSAYATLLGTTNATDLQFGTSGTVRMTVASGGGITMNTLTAAAGTPNTICQNNATKEITVNAAVTCTVSSARFKSDIRAWNADGTSIIMRMKPSTFFYKDRLERNRIGLIAEDLNAVDSRLSEHDADGKPNSIDFPAIMAVLIKTAQEQQAKIVSLTRKVERMEAANDHRFKRVSYK